MFEDFLFRPLLSLSVFFSFLSFLAFPGAPSALEAHALAPSARPLRGTPSKARHVRSAVGATEAALDEEEAKVAAVVVVWPRATAARTSRGKRRRRDMLPASAEGDAAEGEGRGGGKVEGRKRKQRTGAEAACHSNPSISQDRLTRVLSLLAFHRLHQTLV